MTVKEAIDQFGFGVCVAGDTDREIAGVYAGDLLSWVMARLEEDCAWITIQGHVNAVAVASLSNAACVIIAEGAAVTPEAVAKAEGAGITILLSELGMYEVSKQFAPYY